MDRINHVKLTTPNPELVDAFLRQVVDIPEGWPLGANAPVITTDMPLGPGGDLDPMVVNDTRNAGVGLNVTGFISGDTTSRQFQILSGENAQVWAVCIGTRYIERARERCTERGIPATPITVADWNERDNIVNFFCVVAGIMFEVIRVEAKEKVVKFYLEYPLLSDADDGAWLNPANIAEFGRVAEAAGVDGIALTDHPAPSKKWLSSGGHETIDPFVGLGFLAAVTQRMRLMTYLAVVPYRNPLLNAKSMTALDVLSGGRATFVLGTGYLRSEFAALGVDFDERNELFDEAVDVMRALWTNPDELHYEGRHFKAIGVTLSPRQVQEPHPPLWLGGNAKVVRDRVAAWGQGWAPLLGGGDFAKVTRTRAIETDEDLALLIAQIRDQMTDNGRDPSTLDVASGSLTPLPRDASVDQRLEALDGLAKIGVTWTHAPFPRSSFAASLDGLRQFGEEIIAKAR